MAAGKLQLPIALDAMGGDNAPACVLRGAEMALIRHPGIRFLLFGNRYILEPLLASVPLLNRGNDRTYGIRHCRGRQTLGRRAARARVEHVAGD